VIIAVFQRITLGTESTMTITTADGEFVRLVQQHKGIIVKICHSYCYNRNERDDLVQEITYQLWKSWKHYQPGQSFSTWMYRVALNVAISFYRKEKRSVQVVAMDEETDMADTDKGDHKEENIRLLQSFIRELKELDRALILLYLESKSYKEIAEILGISETNVATRISRVKEVLKQKFSSVQ
jgi:RNA polymerase sigma factor (sigma-70 family)